MPHIAKADIILNSFRRFIFEKRKINLSKIETRPSRVDGNAHDFFIDLDGHHKDTKVKSALKEIKNSGSFVRLLGSYPKYI